MKAEFSNPPLVELIAELKWLPLGATSSTPGNVNVPSHMLAPGAADAFFMSFASGIGGEGFTRSERLTPPGFPSIPYHPMYRYTKIGANSGTPLFQLGVGLFSAHITPPYKKWEDFRPFLAKGVKTLLQSRNEREASQPFMQGMVRYLDCFTEEHTRGQPVRDFVREALGIEVLLPSFLEQKSMEKPIGASMQISVPIANSKNLNVSIGAGRLGSKSGVVMDSAVVATQEIAADEASIMSFLDDAHILASDFFVQATKPIHDRMGLIK